MDVDVTFGWKYFRGIAKRVWAERRKINFVGGGDINYLMLKKIRFGKNGNHIINLGKNKIRWCRRYGERKK